MSENVKRNSRAENSKATSQITNKKVSYNVFLTYLTSNFNAGDDQDYVCEGTPDSVQAARDLFNEQKAESER